MRQFSGTSGKYYTYVIAYNLMPQAWPDIKNRSPDGAFHHVQDMLAPITSPVLTRYITSECGRQSVAGIDVMRAQCDDADVELQGVNSWPENALGMATI